MTDQIATAPMPEWAAIRYADSMRRATTNARKPWMHVFTWDEVHSFVGEIATQVWKTWEAPHVRSPERYAASDLRLKTMNRLDKEAIRLGWSRTRQSDGSRKWMPPAPVIPSRIVGDLAPSPGADVWIDGEPLRREEIQESLLILLRNYGYLNAEAERLPEPVWEQFSTWAARNDRMRSIRLARRTAEAALAHYAYEVFRAERMAA